VKPVFEILADVFCNEETELCFALLGDANMSWAAALADRGCRFIYVRDEHCAVAAAMAWSRTTGKVGVAEQGYRWLSLPERRLLPKPGTTRK